jgi:uncharacterized protein (TIGR03435 family)
MLPLRTPRLATNFVILSLIATAAASGQRLDGLSFDVASIKENVKGANVNGSNPLSMSLQPGGRFVANNATAKNLIRYAYDVHEFQIRGGPRWVESVKFDVDARANTGASVSRGEAAAMLQSLLHERFHLRVHEEFMKMQGYQLIVAAKGVKLRRSTSNTERVGMRFGSQEFAGSGVTISLLAAALSQQIGAPVLDQTGLEGPYDIKLVRETAPVAPDTSPTPGSIEPGDSWRWIVPAIREQLGLELRPLKTPMKTVVIDDVRLPSND